MYKRDHKLTKSKLAANSDHPYIILIIGGSGSRKRNTLLNLIKQ